MNITIAYKTLGISTNASIEEVKQAYKKLVKKYHPDIYNGLDADEITARINNAYEMIKKYLASNLKTNGTYQQTRTYTYSYKETPKWYDSSSYTKSNEEAQEWYNYSSPYTQNYEEKTKWYDCSSPYLKYKVPVEAIIKLKKTQFQIIDEYLKYVSFCNSFGINIKFEDWLKDELTITDLCNKMNVDRNNMTFLYNSRNIEDAKLSFANWLNKFYINIVSLYENKLNQSISELETEYEKDILHNNIPFIRWLDIKLYHTVGKIYFKTNILDTFNEYCKANNNMTFEEWLNNSKAYTKKM